MIKQALLRPDWKQSGSIIKQVPCLPKVLIGAFFYRSLCKHIHCFKNKAAKNHGAARKKSLIKIPSNFLLWGIFVHALVFLYLNFPSVFASIKWRRWSLQMPILSLFFGVIECSITEAFAAFNAVMYNVTIVWFCEGEKSPRPHLAFYAITFWYTVLKI